MVYDDIFLTDSAVSAKLPKINRSQGLGRQQTKSTKATDGIDVPVDAPFTSA